MTRKPSRRALIDVLDRMVAETDALRPPAEAEVKRVVYAVYMLGTLLNREADALLAGWRLNFFSYGILAALRRAGPRASLAPTELATILGLTPGGVSNLLRRLERQGRVARERDRTDRRGVSVRLTVPGRRIADVAIEALAAEEARRLRGLGATGRRRLYTILREVIGSFDGA